MNGEQTQTIQEAVLALAQKSVQQADVDPANARSLAEAALMLAQAWKALQ